MKYATSPSFALVFPSYYLDFVEGGSHTFALLKKAEGISLQSLMEKFQGEKIDQDTINLAAKAFYDLGAEMAWFYKKNGSSLYNAK